MSRGRVEAVDAEDLSKDDKQFLTRVYMALSNDIGSKAFNYTIILLILFTLYISGISLVLILEGTGITGLLLLGVFSLIMLPLMRVAVTRMKHQLSWARLFQTEYESILLEMYPFLEQERAGDRDK